MGMQSTQVPRSHAATAQWCIMICLGFLEPRRLQRLHRQNVSQQLTKTGLGPGFDSGFDGACSMMLIFPRRQSPHLCLLHRR